MIGLKRGTIQITDYDPAWAKEFEAEKQLLQSAFKGCTVSIEHVGSTAVPGLAAKPIIDIEVGVAHFADWRSVARLAEKVGYIYMPDRVFEEYVFMPKGPEGCRTHYLHIAAVDSDEWRNVITFRDALRSNTKLRDDYVALKHALAAKFANRADYTAAKAEFILTAINSL